MDDTSEHIIEVAKAQVQIKGGEVTVLSDPHIHYCPTWGKVLQINGDLDKKMIKEIIERRIKLANLFTPDRIIESDLLIFSFGASELLYCGLTAGEIDAAIIVCDGAGTIVSDNPRIIQGVGGWMSGIVKTSPIPGIISRLKKKGTLIPDEEHAGIDPVAGVRLAVANGYKKIAVTVAERDIGQIAAIRELESETGSTVIILSVCTGAISRETAELLSRADLIWSCASKNINEVLQPKSVFTTRRIKPIYSMSEEGKHLILVGSKYYKNRMTLQMDDEPEKQPYPMI